MVYLVIKALKIKVDKHQTSFDVTHKVCLKGLLLLALGVTHNSEESPIENSKCSSGYQNNEELTFSCDVTHKKTSKEVYHTLEGILYTIQFAMLTNGLLLAK